MDNAAKALLMVGGVLLSMAVIGLAIATYSNAQNLASASEESMSTSQIESFNRFYTAYRTTYTGPTSIRCIDAVNILNRAVEDEVAITLRFENGPACITEAADGYYTAAPEDYTTKNLKYTIEFLDDIGIVTRVTITD